jgi:NADPH2:quinone reductase
MACCPARPPWLRFDLLTRNLTLTGCGGLTVWLSDVRKVLAMAASGQLRPRVDSVLPLADAAEAHRRFEDRRAIGKIVLVP